MHQQSDNVSTFSTTAWTGLLEKKGPENQASLSMAPSWRCLQQDFMHLPELLESICFPLTSPQQLFLHLIWGSTKSPSGGEDMCSFQSSCGLLKAFKSWFFSLIPEIFSKKPLHSKYLSSRSTYTISISLEIIISLLHVFSASISLLSDSVVTARTVQWKNDQDHSLVIASFVNQ